MSYTNVFKRYELKYLLTPAQHDAVLRGIAPYMQLDDYGRTTIRNIYFGGNMDFSCAVKRIFAFQHATFYNIFGM